jgi:hypothetical protein
MNKRELTRQAKHVLGPKAAVSIYKADSVYWIAAAGSANHTVFTAKVSRSLAVSSLHSMLVHLDVSGWSWMKS